MKRQPYEHFICECGEPCIMVPHERTGKLAPITIRVYDDGNIVLVQATDNGPRYTYRILAPDDRLANAGLLRLNHFSNCPLREQFGGRPRTAAASSAPRAQWEDL